jgi:hypothetical protein
MLAGKFKRGAMSETPNTPRGTYRVADGAPVPWADAVDAWSTAARPVLEGVARRYGTWITYGELADKVQSEAGIRTTKLLQYWIGEVLGRVARAQPPSEPALTSLVVQSTGEIGSGFEEIAKEREPTPPLDIEAFAANERLECHKYFGAELPDDGGGPIYTHQIEARRARERRSRAALTEPELCPTCHVQLPLNGDCELCR